jgi:hypothetical protein
MILMFLDDMVRLAELCIEISCLNLQELLSSSLQKYRSEKNHQNQGRGKMTLLPSLITVASKLHRATRTRAGIIALYWELSYSFETKFKS